jgi:hypothetical protein
MNEWGEATNLEMSHRGELLGVGRTTDLALLLDVIEETAFSNSLIIPMLSSLDGEAGGTLFSVFETTG